MIKLPKRFEENVARILAENKISGRKPSSEKELADSLGVTPQAVSKTLGADIRLSTLESYATALGVAPHTLLAGSEDHPNRRETLREAIRLLRALDQGVDSPVLQEFFRVKVPKK